MGKKTVSKKTLRKSFNHWFFWNGCSQQAETMLGMAFGQAMAPVIDELYDAKEEKAEGLKRHITLFNTESQVGSVCNGICIGMEEQYANGVGSAEMIRDTKVAMIGPTGAIGDSLWVATFIPLLLTLCVSLSQSIPSVPWIGSLIYMIGYPVMTYFISRRLFHLGYRAGLDGMRQIMASGRLDKIKSSVTVLTLLVIGALTASFVSCDLHIDVRYTAQIYDAASQAYMDKTVSVFNPDQILNEIFPKIVPLGLTLFVYRLYTKKNWSPLAIMGIVFALAVILTAIGYIPGVGVYA